MNVPVGDTNIFSSYQTFQSGLSTYSCEPKQEKHEDQQYSQSLSIQHNEMMLNANKKREKKGASFPFGKCRICQDTATGVHYGVITCEGCKGFFKRSITQGLPYRCFFGDKCIINMETRNRCKACRFKRCLRQGMAIESVKMGRIPKKVKEKALRDYHKYQEKRCQYDQQPSDDNHNNNPGLYYDDCFNSFEMNSYTFSSFIGESISSVSSVSSSSTSSTSLRQSSDSSQDNVIESQTTINSIEQSFPIVDVIESTISSSNIHSNNFNNKLSSLQLPSIFYESHSSNETYSNSLSEHSIKSNRRAQLNYDNYDDHSLENIQNNSSMKTSKYTSQINTTDDKYTGDLHYSKHVLQTMKYLASKLCQPFLIYELDFEVTTFFRYIRWKMFNFYSQYTKQLRIFITRMVNHINFHTPDYINHNVSVENIWTDIQASIPKHKSQLFNFAKDIPGLHELNTKDFEHILYNRAFEFWMILYYPLFYKNESYIMTNNDLHLNRHFMNEIFGKQVTDAFHEFCERLHKLNLTPVEHSLLIPIVLCLPDDRLIDSESVHIIKYCYMYALYIQLCSTRTEDESKLVFEHILQITNSIEKLNEFCKNNVHDHVLNKIISAYG